MKQLLSNFASRTFYSFAKHHGIDSLVLTHGSKKNVKKLTNAIALQLFLYHFITRAKKKNLNLSVVKYILQIPSNKQKLTRGTSGYISLRAKGSVSTALDDAHHQLDSQLLPKYQQHMDFRTAHRRICTFQETL